MKQTTQPPASVLLNFEPWQAHYGSERAISSARSERLQPAEASLFKELHTEITLARVLDLGVGAGRTSAHLAPRCAHYRALDYAAPMLDTCRERYGHRPWYSSEMFAQGDARQLPYADASFDFVLFSYNGIDVMDPLGRERVLHECRRVLRQGGVFIYSSHNLNWYDGPGQLPRRRGWGDWFGEIKHLRQMRRLNASLGCTRGHGLATLLEPPHAYSVVYGRPAEHLAQTRAAGFTQPRCFDGQGFEVTHPQHLAQLRDPWLYYMARATGP